VVDPLLRADYPDEVGWIIGGIVLCLVAGSLEWGSRRQRHRFEAVLGTDATTCRDVAALFTAVESETGAGTLAHMVELRAKAVAAGTAPLSGKPAAWFRSVVTEEYLEWEETASPAVVAKSVGGKDAAPVRPDRRLVERKRVLEEHRFDGYLVVDDGGGRVSVDLDGTDVEDAQHVVDRLDRDERHRAGRPGRVGVHHTEWIVAPGTELTVVGEARHRDGTVVVADPKGKAPLLVSTRTGDELASGAERTSVALRAGAAVVGLLGLALVVVGIAT
jgi:hypothetical protein